MQGVSKKKALLNPWSVQEKCPRYTKKFFGLVLHHLKKLERFNIYAELRLKVNAFFW